MDTLRGAFGVFLHPKSATSTSMSIGQALKFYYTIMIIPLILGLIVSYLAATFIPSALGLALIALIAVYFIVGFPLGILIDGGIYHIIIGKLFRLYRADYSKVTTALAYSLIPTLFTGWLSLPLLASAGGPVSGVSMGASYIVGTVIVAIFSIWAFIVLIFALSNQLRMSKLKAFGTLVLNGVIVLAVIFSVELALGLSVLGAAGL